MIKGRSTEVYRCFEDSKLAGFVILYGFSWFSCVYVWLYLHLGKIGIIRRVASCLRTDFKIFHGFESLESVGQFQLIGKSRLLFDINVSRRKILTKSHGRFVDVRSSNRNDVQFDLNDCKYVTTS